MSEQKMPLPVPPGISQETLDAMNRVAASAGAATYRMGTPPTAADYQDWQGFLRTVQHIILPMLGDGVPARLNGEEDPVPFETVQEAFTGERSALRFASEMDLDKRVEALVEGCLPSAGVGCLYAQPGIGKSSVAVDLAFRIASGMDEWAGQRINLHGDVAYIAMEGGESLRSFIRGWRREHPEEFESSRVAFYTVSDADEEMQPLVQQDKQYGTTQLSYPGVRQLKSWIALKGLAPRLIILDTQIDMMDPEADENSSGPSAQMYRVMQKLGLEYGCFVLFLHHAVKSASRTDKPTYRGSSAFAAKADVMAYLQGVSSGRGNGKLVFEKRKDFGGSDPKVPYTAARDHDGNDLCVSWEQPSNAELADTPEAEAEERRQRTITEIWQILNAATKTEIDPTTGVFVTNHVPMSTSGVANALRELSTREVDPVDVLFGRTSIGNLLDELNTSGVVVNLENSVKNGKPAKWTAGRQPVAGGED